MAATYTKPQTTQIEVQVRKLVNPTGKRVAFATVTFHGLTIDGFSIVNGDQGLFVGVPQEKGKDGKWYKRVRASEELLQDISTAVLSAYSRLK